VDGRGELYVADFGLAKVLSDPGMTTAGDLLGTVRYMSPEQAGSKHDLVDHRSDIYSLGVTLYELLTLTPAFDGPDRNAILTRVGSSEPTAPRRVERFIPRDLETVVLNTIERDPTRRYQSARELAADLRRFLENKPVVARQATLFERTRRFTDRNRRLMATTALIAITLVAATVFSAWQAVLARDAQKQAEADRDRTEISERKAATEAAIAKSINEFFQNDVLLQVTRAPESNDEFASSRNITVREAVFRAAARIDQAFHDQPLVEAAVRTTIGQALNGVEESKLAIPHLERAVSLRRLHYGAHHPETFASMDSLARAYHQSGRIPDAVTLRRHIWEYWNAVLGPDDPETLRSLGNLAVAYESSGQLELCRQLQQQMVDGRRSTLGPTHSETLSAQHALAVTLRKLGRVEEAVAQHEQALAIWHQLNVNWNDADNWVLITVAVTYQAAGRLDQADRLLHKKLEIDQRRRDSIGLLSRAVTLGWLARTRLLQQRYSEGEPFAREALTIFEREQPGAGGSYFFMTILGSLLAGQGKSAEAESQLLQGCRGMRSGDTAAIFDRDWRLRDACERIINFYEMTKQMDQARAWREMLPP
jgi:tetratricopeptide (TPR) repeat protein